MAWRDKLLIKGLVHSSSEYLVAGKAAQPAGDRALFLTSCLLAPLCTASSWAVVGAETSEPSGHQEPRGVGHWGVAPAGRMLFAALRGPDVGTGLLQNPVTGLQCRTCAAWCRRGTCSHLCILAAALPLPGAAGGS